MIDRMKHVLLLSILVAAACSAPSSTFNRQSTVVEPDPEKRAVLFDTVAALAGRWVSVDQADSFTEFDVTSNGSVVRERMMIGEASEMTNMYSLDGNALRLTHYCAAGNQPHMRANAAEGGRLEFLPDGVSGRKSEDEFYMGQMTLVVVSKDDIEQHWKGFGPDPHDTVIKLRRIR